MKRDAAGMYQCVIFLADNTNITKNVQLNVADISDHLLMDVGKKGRDHCPGGFIVSCLDSGYGGYIIMR